MSTQSTSRMVEDIIRCASPVIDSPVEIYSFMRSPHKELARYDETVQVRPDSQLVSA